MKKSILSLSAAVALGALGFAGSANAIAVFDGTNANATGLLLNPAGTGHMLFTPYYTAQDQMSTLVNIVNTDSTNGKAVKVRFRSASNSDDVLDFTLFLSPGDVWSGAVTVGANGFAQINSAPDETSCTIPVKAAFPGDFRPIRLPSYVTDDVQQALTREGYVEVLNMADIPPNTEKGSLFKAIKHVKGVAPCDALPADLLLSTELTDASGAAAAGLSNPTGQLMGSWTIINQADMGSFSGAQTAVAATSRAGLAPNLAVEPARGYIAFAPQIEAAVGNQPLVNILTSDPLLTGVAPVIQPLWYDLPDMSTPLTGGSTMAQLSYLTVALAKPTIMNEYIATDAGADVPFNTDWVVSQPTRRYWAAVDYGSSASAAKVVHNASVSGAPFDPYTSLTLRQTDFGPQACMTFSFGSYDREENQRSAAGGFSPGTTYPYCGEVFTVQFGTSSVLGAKVTARSVNTLKVGQAGWGRLSSTGGSIYGVPMTGYAAVLFTNTATGLNYNMTIPHAWTGGYLP